MAPARGCLRVGPGDVETPRRPARTRDDGAAVVDAAHDSAGAADAPTGDVQGEPDRAECSSVYEQRAGGLRIEVPRNGKRPAQGSHRAGVAEWDPERAGCARARGLHECARVVD